MGWIARHEVHGHLVSPVRIAAIPVRHQWHDGIVSRRLTSLIDVTATPDS